MSKMANRIRVQAEVEQILGRTMTHDEGCLYITLRQMGYANPYDIVAKLQRDAA